MMNRFKVIVPSFNCVDYIHKCLQSIQSQTDKEYDVSVIDDCSTIKVQREIILEYCQRNHWNYHFNDKNLGALAGMVHAIPQLSCQDEDVIVVIDGDDWLAHPNVFASLRKIYTEHDIALTWGQCEIYPQKELIGVRYAQPVTEMVIKQKLYRDIPFVFWHLGTFKYLLWRHLKDEDLRDINGEYFRIMKDKATLYPLMEMAGEKVHFVDEILYIYNMENPLNDYVNTAEEEHLRVDALIRNRKRYKTFLFP
jgi:glycosyltransferase involved in cell wall biosynthesis